MTVWLTILGFSLFVGFAVLWRMAGRTIVTHDVGPASLERFVENLLEVFTDQSKLFVRLEGGEDCLRVVKHIETETVVDLYIAIEETDWKSLSTAADRIAQHGLPSLCKSGFEGGERLEVHDIEGPRHAVDLILLLFGLDRDGPGARFCLHYEGSEDLALVWRRSKKIRAGKHY